jgi:GMP synthase-like glutamine amidotransferase
MPYLAAMKRALVFQHMNHDHPGRFLDFFAEDHIVPHAVRLWEGQDIPALADFDLMFVLGGAMDIWDEPHLPWMTAEKQAIREWVCDRAKPYIGVCLGHQLLCNALGSEVALAEQKEVGVLDIDLTDEGRSHRLFEGLGPRHKVIQWHLAEVKQVPPGAQVLAASEATAIQSVAVGEHAVSTQFHCEFSPQTMASWSSLPSYVANLEKHRGENAYPRLLAEAYPLMPEMTAMTRRIYDNLMEATSLRR